MAVGSGLTIGAELGGYRLEALIGRGGMSAVYRAEDLRLGRRVALKVLAPELTQDRRFRERFLAESRLAASIDHANIVPVFEAGEADGLLFIAMRYVEGTDLRGVLREGPLAAERAVALVGQLADALDAAHARGLVHRDVKPSNALVAVEGAREHVYLADFGLTKHATSRGGPTASGQMVGTVDYVAPEQIRGDEIDGRADLYSLGCVLFECLTGEVPFPRRSDVATIYAHLEEDPPRPSESRAHVPPALDGVLARALAKDPRRRWQTGADLAAAALAALPGGAASARTRRLPRVPRRALLLAGLGGLVAMATLAGVLLAGGSRGGASLAAIDANAVAVIDPGHTSLSATIRVGASPSQMAVGEGAVWVTNTDEATVSRIDAGTRTVRQTIPVRPGPSAIAAGDGGVWVVNSLDGSVSWISPATSEVVKTIGVGNGPRGICVGGGAVWVANGDDSSVTRIDPRDGRVTATIPLDVRPAQLACGGGALWVSSASSPVITEISVARGRVVGSIPVPGGTGAIAFGAGVLWVASPLDGTVSEIDPVRRAVAATFDMGTGSGPVALTPDVSGVWASNQFAETLVHIARKRQAIDRNIRVGNRPQGLALVDGRLWVGVRASGLGHRGGTLRILTEQAFDRWAFDPAAAYSVLLWQVLASTNDGLVGFERVGGAAGNTIVPDLAQSVPTPTDHGRTYTFRLRPDIRYSTGARVRAADVRRQIERVLRTGQGAPDFYTGIIGAERCRQRPAACDLSRGMVVDEGARTITFHLRAPDSDFLYKLALPFAVAVPPGTPKGLTSRQLPATGPYAIARYQPGRWLELARNPEFHTWSAAAQPDGFPNAITVRFGVKQRDAVSAVEKGTADWVSGAVAHDPRAELDTLFSRYAGQVHANTQAATVYFFLNTRVPPFDNRDARRALNYAVDRQVFAAIEGGSRAASKPACQILPANFPAHRAYCPYTVHRGQDGAWHGPDIAKAKRLVARSRTKGVRVTVWAPKPELVQHARAVVRVLKTLGYRAAVHALPDTRYWDYVQDSRHRAQIGLQFWAADYPGASDFLWLLFGCPMFVPNNPAQPNMSEYCDRTSDRLMRKALAATDRSVANALWARAERRIVDQAAAVPVVNPGTIDVLSSRVGNYQYWGIGPVLLDQLWVR